MADYILIRSKRKTIALHILSNNLEVRAPLKMPKAEIDKSVASRGKWIEDKLRQRAKLPALRNSFTLGYGDKILYRGNRYQILAMNNIHANFDGKRFCIPPGLSAEQIKATCVQVYRLLAKTVLTEKALDFAKKMNVKPASVKISNAATSWGSCSSKKSLRFSWRLIMADDDVIDYVVIHELAHIIEMNHSVRFWAIVNYNIPDYKERKMRLKALQLKLCAENWR